MACSCMIRHACGRACAQAFPRGALPEHNGTAMLRSWRFADPTAAAVVVTQPDGGPPLDQGATPLTQRPYSGGMLWTGAPPLVAWIRQLGICQQVQAACNDVKLYRGAWQSEAAEEAMARSVQACSTHAGRDSAAVDAWRCSGQHGRADQQPGGPAGGRDLVGAAAGLERLPLRAAHRLAGVRAPLS